MNEVKKSRKKTGIIIILLSVCVVVGGLLLRDTPPPIVDVTEVSFQMNEIDLLEDETTDLQYEILPSDATDATVEFKSSNEDIASVSNGKIVAISEGTCSITISSSNGKTDSLVVIVSKDVPNFQQLFSTIHNGYWCDVAEDGSWMNVDSNPGNYTSYTTPDSISTIQEINEKLGFPTSTYVNMTKTTASAGVCEFEDDNYRASWTYHPDRGLEVFYEMKK